MTLRAVVASDFHIDAMRKNLGPAALSKVFKEIRKIYDYAVENGIEHLFIPGDLTDREVMSEDALSELLLLLLEYDNSVTTYYITGNHDYGYKLDGDSKTSLGILKILADGKVFKRFKLFYKPKLMTIDGIDVGFMPFPHNEVPESKKNRGRLILAHIECAGALGDNGRPLKHGNEDKVIRTKKDYIVSGHIHMYQVVESKRLIYCGNIFQKNFGEKLPKGFLDIKVSYNDKNSIRLVHTFVNNRPEFILKNFIIKDQEDWSKLKKSENIRYKIFIDRDAGVVVPKNISREFTNIVAWDSISTKSLDMSKAEDIVQAQMEQAANLKDLPTFNPRTGLKKFLKKNGLTGSADIKKAKSYVEEAIRHVTSLTLEQE